MIRAWRRLAVGAAIVAALALAGCSTPPAYVDTATATNPQPAPEFEWVVVKFPYEGIDAGFELQDELSPWSLDANAAVKDAGAGFLDGNELGGGSFDLYFAGDDRDAIWAVLEPLLATAPAEWSQVLIMASRDESFATIVLPES